MARVEVTPIIDNTRMEAYYNSSNVLRSYFIYPIEGYVLHDKELDIEARDPETFEPTGEIKQGFVPYPSYLSVGYNYDWTLNTRELFTVLADTIPEDQIFGNGGDHEVMSDDTDTKTE